MITSQVAADTAVPVVCIGLSAGGVVPVIQLVRALDPSTHMAFVVIHHLGRQHPTALVDILAHCTRMPVQLATNHLSVEPDNVYVLPSGDEITLNDGTFEVQPRTKLSGWPNLISLFIESLSHSSHPGIAVVLSGMDADGAIALSDLKHHGGIVIAQSPVTASVPEMPRTAIRTGLVDYILDPPEIGTRLNALSTQMHDREGSAIFAGVPL